METSSKGETIAHLRKEPTKPPPSSSTQRDPPDPGSPARDAAFCRPAGGHDAASSAVRHVGMTGDGLEAETGERSEVQRGGEMYDSLEGSTGFGFEVRRSSTRGFPTGDQDAYQEMGGTEASGLHSRCDPVPHRPSLASSLQPHQCRELPSDDDDAYSDLRYDPDWHSKLKASEQFCNSPRGLQGEHQPGSTWSSQGDYSMGEELVIKGGYRYVVAASPSLPAGSPSTAPDEAQGPYRLHPQRSPTTRGMAGTSGYPNHPRSSGLCLPEANQTLGKGYTTIQRESSHGDTGEDHKVPAQPHHNVPETQEVAAGKQSKNTSKLKSPLLANRNLERTREDIVERNKITLGRNTTKCDSYLKAHAPKQEPDDMTASQISRRDKPQQKGTPNPWRPSRAPRPGAADRPGHRLCPPPGGGGGGGGARPQARKELSLKNTPPVVLPPISSSGDSAHSQTPATSPSQSGHGTEVSTTGAPLGLHRVSYWDPKALVGYLDVQFPGDVHAPWRQLHGAAGGRGLVSPDYHQPKRGNSPVGFQNKLTSVGRVQRAQAPQWLLSYDEERFPSHNPDEDENVFTRDSPGWTGGVQLRRSGSHLVLPPIGDDGWSGGGGALLSTRSISPMRRSSEPACSSGYLAQMERQKQLKERVAYKVYTLKDYRQLKQVVNLCGLGPDKANEKTAEKMRRQRLYSNVIREQNKKTSTIPLLPSPKDPEDIDKKVPRRKALEYAKSIAKPHPKPQPKKRQDQSEGFPGLLGAAHLEGLDLAQLKMLDDMRRRHEEEKRAVASFRKEHVV